MDKKAPQSVPGHRHLKCATKRDQVQGYYQDSTKRKSCKEVSANFPVAGTGEEGIKTAARWIRNPSECTLSRLLSWV